MWGGGCYCCCCWLGRIYPETIFPQVKENRETEVLEILKNQMAVEKVMKI